MNQEKLIVGKTIKMPAMRRGLVKYPEETILVEQRGLENLAKSAYGIPVVIEHPGVKITPETFKDLEIHGRVADMQYNPDDDIWYINFIVDTQEAVDNLNSGWGISTAWIAENYGPNGTHNAMPYDKELLEGKYEHLAIVKDPRYEMAKGPVFYNSLIDTKKSQEIGDKKMVFKLFRMKKEEIKTNESDNYVVNVDGEDIPLANILEDMKKMENKKNEDDEKKEAKALNGDEMVEYDGKKMTVNELVEKYNAMKKNEDDEKKEENQDDEKKEENQDDENKEENEDDEKKENSLDRKKKRFNEMKDTHDNAHTVNNEVFTTMQQRQSIGAERYGSNK